MGLDTPGNNLTVSSVFQVADWAIDLSSTSGTGVDTVHVWATPTDGGSAVFLGVASYGTARTDVGSVYGTRFTNCGFNLRVGSLPPGTYAVAAYAHSTVTKTFNNAVVTYITVQ